MKTVLIATTNEGKVKELKELLSHIPITCISLQDLDRKLKEPEETESSIEGNAILKAKYYARQTGYATIADDGGLFIDTLNGWPGVHSARVASTTEERIKEVQKRLENITDEKKRTASFRAALAFFDPLTNDLFVSTGETKGVILKEKKGESDFGYDPIFYIPETKKTYAEMSKTEKNKLSHRGKAITGIKRYILNTYGGKHLVVPIGIVVKNGKILVNKRNDTEKPELHGLWEFPGGGVEIGERVEESVIREVREESGYQVEIITQLRYVWTVQIKNPRSTHYSIQIYLLPFICKIVGGDGVVNDQEVLETAWVEPEKVIEYELIGENRKMYEGIYAELLEVIKNNNL